jgi:hypothetical protein
MRPARLLVVVAMALGACSLTVRAASSQVKPDVAALLDRIGERVARYYHRAQSIVCVETATMQPINRDWSFEGMARTVESELRVEAEDADGQPLKEARLVRNVRRVNGREPRERDKKDRSGCTDPDPFSEEPLNFLLPSHREEYRFTAVHEGRERNRAAVIIDFETFNRKSRPDLIEDERGHDDCFGSKGPIATSGRLWADAVTSEVLRVDTNLLGPVELRVSWPMQRRYNFPQWVVLDRDDLSVRYREVAFTDPDERILLPESIDALTIFRNTLQPARRTTTFSDYHRFLTTSRVRAKIGGP